MPCYYPLQAYQCQVSKQVSFNSRTYRDARPINLPCGQCEGCRFKRSREWAIRCMHEASLYVNNCFITLTYNDENLPLDRSLHYDEFQKFMKRLRFSYQGCQPKDDGTRPIRFYMCGEYGTQFGRPHYHACLFNFDFPDKKEWKKSETGEMLYRSKILEELWPYGYSSIGSVTFQSAAYVARYIMKKITGKLSADHYRYTDPDTGEVFDRTPEFNKMSLKPGIGADWINKWTDDVYPNDYVIVKGRKLPPPKYYDKLFSKHNPYEWDEISHQRHENALKWIDDNTPERLEVKRQVQLANLQKLKRKIT